MPGQRRAWPPTHVTPCVTANARHTARAHVRIPACLCAAVQLLATPLLPPCLIAYGLRAQGRDGAGQGGRDRETEGLGIEVEGGWVTGRARARRHCVDKP